MNNLIVEEKEYLPLINFNVNGKLKIEGMLLPENVRKFFEPLFDFVGKLDVESVIFDINLEYFNTASSKEILELLRHLESNNKVASIMVNWYYEEGDEDSAEMGEIYEECLEYTQFRYHEYAEMS